MVHLSLTVTASSDEGYSLLGARLQLVYSIRRLIIVTYFWSYFLSPGAKSDRIRTFELRILKRLFCHCTIAGTQSFRNQSIKITVKLGEKHLQINDNSEKLF
jgi:hypothetical protein